MSVLCSAARCFSSSPLKINWCVCLSTQRYELNSTFAGPSLQDNRLTVSNSVSSVPLQLFRCEAASLGLCVVLFSWRCIMRTCVCLLLSCLSTCQQRRVSTSFYLLYVLHTHYHTACLKGQNLKKKRKAQTKPRWPYLHISGVIHNISCRNWAFLV